MTSGRFEALSPKDRQLVEASLREAYPSLLKIATRILARFRSEGIEEVEVVSIAVTKLWVAIERYRPELDPARRPIESYFSSAYARRSVRNETISAIRASRHRNSIFSASPVDLSNLPAPSSPDTLEQEEEATAYFAAAARALSSLSARDVAVIRALNEVGQNAEHHALRQHIQDSIGETISESEFANAKSRANTRYYQAFEHELAQTLPRD